MSATTSGPSLGFAVDVERLDDDGIVTSTVIDPDLGLLAGHYPGFPIFPGVCLLECAHQSVLAAAHHWSREVDIDAVETTRFLGPVLPGDRVTTDVRFQLSPSAWRCSGVLRTDQGKVAEVRLAYRVRGAP
ncbi:MAG: hypothetical protein M3N68_08445 [Actinomycetota bacterium]|nr:hypothetical protein [Actinomycetota bacterium]